MRVLNLALLAALGRLAAAPSSEPVTFNRDVLPILQKHCQACHRPGQAAPMPLLTYAEARPWAKAIQAAVVSRKMPPWFADPRYGHFANDPSLEAAAIRTIADWVSGGAPEGDPRDAPPPLEWPEGEWRIAPDVVVSLPVFRVPARGALDWVYTAAPSGFTKDTWVTSVEIGPSDPSVVHHAALFFRPRSAGKRRDDPLRGAGSIEAVYVPGSRALDYRAYHAAKLVPAQSDLVFQIHYAPRGREVLERIQVGFTLARQRPKLRFITYSPQPTAIFDRGIFRIPAGEPDWEGPPVEGEFHVDAALVWFQPHMHWRGRDMTYSVTYPDGRQETLLRVDRYDFNWQIGYEPALPVRVPKGTKFRATAHYNNSVSNPLNPDPARDVYGGTQTDDEMMVPFFGVVLDAGADPRKVMTLPGLAGSGGG